MRLYIVQHGEAAPKEHHPDRPLTEKGMADIEVLAAFLKATRVAIRRIYHSGKTRAVQTAETLTRVLKPQGDMEESPLLNPCDPPEPFVQQLLERREDVLVAGHLPFVAKLVAILVTGDAAHAITDFAPGCAVCLEQDDAGWQLIWMVRPEVLEALF